MAEDVILTNIKLEGADQVQDQLRKIGEEGQRAFEKLAQASNQRFDQVARALDQVAASLDRMANARLNINTGQTEQALQRTQSQVKALETTTISAFESMGKSGASAFSFISNSIRDAISLAENYKKTAAAIATGGVIGFVVKGINEAVKDFEALKQAASDAKIGFDDYQKLNFILREIGVSTKAATDAFGDAARGSEQHAAALNKQGDAAKDTAALLALLGAKAEESKKKSGITTTDVDKAGDVIRKTKTFEFVDTGGAEKAVKFTGTIVENLTKINELNIKLKVGLFGDPGSLDAITKYRKALEDLRKETEAAALGPQPQSRGDAFAQKTADSRAAFERNLDEQRREGKIRVNESLDQQILLQRLEDRYQSGGFSSYRAYLQARESIQERFRERAARRAEDFRVSEARQAEKAQEAAAKGEKLAGPGVVRVADFFPDKGLQEANKALKEFQTKPTAEGLEKIAVELAKIGSEAKQLDILKKAFGGAEAPAKALQSILQQAGAKVDDFNLRVQGLVGAGGAAFDELNLKAQGLVKLTPLEQYFVAYQKLAQVKKEDEKNTKALTEANENLSRALFEVGFASTQGKINLGLTFAPVIAPAIDAVANGIRKLNFGLRDLVKDIGSSIGPAIDQLFNMFREGGKDFVSLPEGNMFKGFVDGIKGVKDAIGPMITGLVAAIQPALDILNEFFGTTFTIGDVGLATVLTSLTGGFNTLGIAIAAVFGTSTKSVEDFKKTLSGIGINVDEIIRKVKLFAAEVPRAVREQFETKDQRTARQEQEKQAKAALPGGQDPDEGVKKLARDFAALGTVIVSTGALLLTFRRTMIAIGVGVGLEKLTGVFSALAPVLATAAAGVVFLSNSMTLLITLLGWPAVLVAGLVLVVQNLNVAKGAFGLFVDAINALFGIKLTNLEALAGILALIAVRTGLVTFVMGLFAPAVTTAATAAGAAATGGFAAFLATVSRIAIALGVAVGAIEAFQAIANALDKAKVGAQKGTKDPIFGIPLDTEGSKITDQKVVNEIKDLNIQNRRDTERLRRETDDEKKKLLQERIDARNARLKELQAPVAGATDGATKTIEDSQKDLMERLLKGWADTWDKITGTFGKGADAAAGAAAKAVAKPLQTPEQIKKVQTDVPSDQMVVRDSRGLVYRVPREGAKPNVQIGPVETTPAQPLLQKINLQETTTATEEVKTATESIGDATQNNIEWQNLYNDKVRELNALLNTAVERTGKLHTTAEPPITKLEGVAPTSQIQDVRTLSPDEFRLFQQLSDQANRIREILDGKLDKIDDGIAELAKQAGIESIPKPSGDVATAAPAQKALTTVTQDLTFAEAALRRATNLASGSFDALQATASITNKTFDQFIDGLRQTAQQFASGQQSLGSLDNTTKNLDSDEKTLTQTTGALDEAAKKLRDTFDSFTAKLLAIRDKVVAPADPVKPTSDAPQPAGGGFTTTTTRVPDPNAPGGFRDITVRTPTVAVPQAAPPPGQQTGPAPGSPPGTARVPKTPVPPGTIHPQTGQPLPPGTLTFPPLSELPAAAQIIPGVIDPRTGREFPPGTAFMLPGTQAPITPPPGQEPTEATKPSPKGPVPFTLEPADPNDPTGRQVPVFRTPGGRQGGPVVPRLTPEEVAPVPPSRTVPRQTEPIVRDDGSVLMPDGTVLPKPAPAKPVTPTVPPVLKGPVVPEIQNIPVKPLRPGDELINLIPELGASFDDLRASLVSLGSAAAEVPDKVGETSDAFADWSSKIVEGVDRVEKRPPATREQSEIKDVWSELMNALNRNRLPDMITDQITNRINRRGSTLLEEAGVPQIGRVPQQDRPPESAPQLDLPQIPSIPGIISDEAEGLISTLTRLGTAAQGAAQALEPITPALEQVSQSAQSVPQEVQQADQAFEQIDFGQAVQEVEQFVQEVNQVFERLKAPQTGSGAATGGLITGPGTDTSDSIPILASANEFMMRAAAVRHYGRDFMYRVNSMSFPRLSMGGLVDILNTPLSGQIRLPRFSEGGSIQPSSGGVPVHVNFEGRRVFSASAQRSSIEQLKRESLLQKVRSGGPSPFWVE